MHTYLIAASNRHYRCSLLLFWRPSFPEEKALEAKKNTNFNLAPGLRGFAWFVYLKLDRRNR